jgi:predicted RecB family nuclease
VLTELRNTVRLKAIEKIRAQYSKHTLAMGVTLTRSALSGGNQFLLDTELEDDRFSVHFDGLKKVDGRSDLGDFHYIPVLFHEGRQILKPQRLLLETLGLLLSRVQGRAAASGVVYHGSDCRATIVRLTAGLQAAERLLQDVIQMREGEATPKLLLNDHCAVCEFRRQCHDQAVKEDNLSLLRGLKEKEIKSYARKGLFTLTQIAHTFRPRRKGKRSNRSSKKRYHSLQALAIRDRKVYVLGTPEVPSGPVRIFLDV